jgi:hypothetical protein
MLAQGWRNIAAIDISRRATDKSVLVFQQGEPKRCPMMCLSLNDVDKFRLIHMPADIVSLFKQILLSRWSKGIQEEKILSLSFGNVLQIKLKGWPWSGGICNDVYHIRSFLCNIIEAFSAQGWRVLMAGDVSAKFVSQDKGPDYPIDVHSFWFIHEPTSAQQFAASSYGFNVPAAAYGGGITQAPYPPGGAAYLLGTVCLKQPHRTHLLLASLRGTGCILTHPNRLLVTAKLLGGTTENNEQPQSTSFRLVLIVPD